MFEHFIASLREKKPLVHSITNYVTVNDCANIILAVGASPIMADDEGEVAEIVSLCNALVINIGTLNARTIHSMLLAGRAANNKGIPVVLDPVGNGASTLRTDTTNRLLKEIRFAVIRGNSSEIKMAYSGVSGARGVDAEESDLNSTGDTGATAQMAKAFAAKTGSVIAITGKVDVVANSNTAYAIRNGHEAMGRITGTGCMCTALIGSCCGASGDYLKAAACGITVMGLAGEMAWDKVRQTGAGTSSMRMHIIDAVSNMSDEILAGGMKVETL